MATPVRNRIVSSDLRVIYHQFATLFKEALHGVYEKSRLQQKCDNQWRSFFEHGIFNSKRCNLWMNQLENMIGNQASLALTATPDQSMPHPPPAKRRRINEEEKDAVQSSVQRHSLALSTTLDDSLSSAHSLVTPSVSSASASPNVSIDETKEENTVAKMEVSSQVLSDRPNRTRDTEIREKFRIIDESTTYLTSAKIIILGRALCVDLMDASLPGPYRKKHMTLFFRSAPIHTNDEKAMAETIRDEFLRKIGTDQISFSLEVWPSAHDSCGIIGDLALLCSEMRDDLRCKGYSSNARNMDPHTDLFHDAFKNRK